MHAIVVLTWSVHVCVLAAPILLHLLPAVVVDTASYRFKSCVVFSGSVLILVSLSIWIYSEIHGAQLNHYFSVIFRRCLIWQRGMDERIIICVRE